MWCPAVVETQSVAPHSGDSDRQHYQSAKQHGLAESSKRRPRTDQSDYLLPMSAMAYLDVIDDTGNIQ